MNEINFPEIFDKLKADVYQLAELTLKKYIVEAKNDARDILENMKVKLKKWTILLANESIDTAEFEWLLFSQKDLVEMTALKEAGLALVRVDHFKNSVINIVIDTVFAVIKII